MTLNESVVVDDALEWFRRRHGYAGQVGEQSRVAPTLTPAFSPREKEDEREAIRRLDPALNPKGSESRLEAVT